VNNNENTSILYRLIKNKSIEELVSQIIKDTYLYDFIFEEMGNDFTDTEMKTFETAYKMSII